MRPDAEKDGAKWASKNDNRVTRIGNFIRKYRVDELPQLINVFKGEIGAYKDKLRELMSIPRSADQNFQGETKSNGKKKAKPKPTPAQKSNHPTGGYVPPHLRKKQDAPLF